MAHKERFWDRAAGKYARSPIKNEAAFREKLRRTQSYLSPTSDVFEFGCGTGSIALEHAPFTGQIICTDISGAMIEIAREKLAAAKLGNVDFQQADFETMDLPSQRFDMVMAHSILHLVEDLDAVLSRVHQILKPGGVFVSSTTCLDDFMRIFKYIGPIGYRLRLLPYVSVISGDELRAAHQRAGFEMVDDWQPGPKEAIFIVARKTGGVAA